MRNPSSLVPRATAREKLNLSAERLQQLPGEPNLLVVLNLIEVVYDHVAYPILGEQHGYYGHTHLSFDGPQGKERFRADVNDLFRRYGLAYELEEDGAVIRVAPEVVHDSLVTQFLRQATIRSTPC